MFMKNIFLCGICLTMNDLFANVFFFLLLRCSVGRKEYLMLCRSRASCEYQIKRDLSEHLQATPFDTHPPQHSSSLSIYYRLQKKNVLFFAYIRKVEEVSVEMGFYYDDVAIYSDSMIYSNLRCFYQIKFIFCTKPRDVECIQRSDLLV